MSRAYIGIGSNLGSREENCKSAIRHLIDNGIKVLKLSSMIETEPWGVKDQPKFINIAVEVETVLGPEELLRLLKKIETDIGRRPTIHWGPRLIDLDILLYDDIVLKTPDLEIPHPGIADRYFVLRPLADIAAEIIHPALNKSIKILLSEISA